MRERPDLPRARDSVDEVVARLVDDVLDALRLEHADVREEHHAEARVPQHLYAKNAHTKELHKTCSWRLVKLNWKRNKTLR